MVCKGIETINEEFETWIKKQRPNGTHPFLRECNEVDADRRYQQFDTEFEWECYLAGYREALKYKEV